MRSLTVQTSNQSKQGLAHDDKTGNHTLLREKFDECGFKGWNVRADGAVLQLDVETNGSKMRKPA
jgi:hypothetical protein